ncbi:MAG: fructosamine kinase family protein [Saprospiraceae bacterium]|nr:fructosamine kinase family protein [Saprospiraceae bacterium]
MTPDLLRLCESILEVNIISFTPLRGGDISDAYQVATIEGPFFLKVLSGPAAAEMLQQEEIGLREIAKTGTVKTPLIRSSGSRESTALLLLEFIESGNTSPDFWKSFGQQLARLHQTNAPSFGFRENNFIGSLTQRNRRWDCWPDFYQEERLAPQVKLAYDQGLLDTGDLALFDHIYTCVAENCPEEVPSLIHGDLWSGNFLCSTSGEAVLIDPAVAFSHREMDLAMCRLFNGFDRKFYRAYEEAYPIERGFESRLPLYQLYYLLVHLNIFGRGYYSSVRQILTAFA